MPDNGLQIALGVDASGLAQGLAQARKDLADAAAAMAAAQRAVAQAADKDALASAKDRLDQGLAMQTAAARATQAVWSSTDAAIAQAQAKQLKQLQQSFSRFVDPLVSSFTSGLVKMAEGTESFRQVMLQLARQLLDDFVRNVVDKKIEAWLWSEYEQVAASTRTATLFTAINARETATVVAGQGAQTSAVAAGAATRAAAEETGAAKGLVATVLANLKKIQSDAAAAAAHAYAAMAGIPPAPLWGVAAGAAAYAGVMAFETLASAAGGFDIPAGVNPITQLHQREMVLPARLANPMRDMLSDYQTGAGAPAAAAAAGGGGRGGDAHLTYAPVINAPQAQSLRQMLVDQGGDMIAFVQRAVRDGSLRVAR
jgi:hypothetical protein